MPLVASPVWSVSVGFQDRDQNISATTVNYSSATSVTDLITEVEDVLIPALQGISNASVISYRISLGANDLDAPVAAEASDIERKAVFQFQAANGAKTKIEVPSVNNSLVVDGTNILDLSNPAVTAVRDAFIVAGADADQPTTSLGAVVTRMFGIPHKIHRGSSKG